MALVVAETSALVSLGTVADREPSPLDLLLDGHEVVVPEQVLSELRETASYDDPSGTAATAVLDRHGELRILEIDLDEDFPLDDGENAAVSLANDRGATQLLCDEFNRLALVHASLADTRLVTTPTLLTAFVHNDRLTAAEGTTLLSAVADARSWGTNAYVERARSTLRGPDR